MSGFLGLLENLRASKRQKRAKKASVCVKRVGRCRLPTRLLRANDPKGAAFHPRR